MRQEAQGTRSNRGFSMAEMIMAMFLVALISAIGLIGFTGFSGGYKFRSKLDSIASLFARSATAASENGRRYGIIFDFIDMSYAMYEVNTTDPYSEDFANLLEEDLIERGYFDKDCQLLYIEFDDGEMIDGGEQGRTLFVVGPAGWDFGGKVVLSNYDGEIYTIVVGRLENRPKVVEGEAMLAEPVFDMTF
ncbi:MAG: Tfp pilus assembly protein FimT/FimU [Sedimentisphaeraceae bacterium JB056]